MKYPKILLGLFIVFVSFQSLVAQETPPPPPGRAPGPPGEGDPVPIDQGIWFLLIAAVLLGVYVILKQNNIAMKNVLPKKLKNIFLPATFLMISIVGWGQSDIIISQYIETNSGSTPKGIEIFNVSGSDFTFDSSSKQLDIYQRTNTTYSWDLKVSIISGTIAADEVWVIGTTDLTGYATTNGTGLSGTTDYSFTFNGDDALKIELGGTVQDIFGNFNPDPGSQWSGGGVNTSNYNLQIKDGICDGDTDGWTDPSVRFDQIAIGSTMTGFGNAPASCNSSEPEIQITGNGIEIVNGDITPDIADDTNFGNVEVAGGSTAHTFTINNTGGADLTIDSLSSDNNTEFAISGITTPIVVSGGGSMTFVVTFDPTVLGTRTATITVENDDADEDPYTFTVQGNGTNSAASDIIANTSFIYTSDIDYLSYQADPISNSSHSIGVFGITLRDGGGTADADALSTELTDLSFTYTGTANTVRAAALFDGNTHLADATDTANGIAFTGLSGADFTADDNSTLDLTLRVSFTTSVVDNEQLQFTIIGATANASGSVFGTADAGGATSSTSGDDNRIEVVADRMVFSVQPTDQTLNTNLAPFTIIATDVNDNQDLDATNNLTLSTSGVGVMTHSSPYTMSGGQAVVSDVQFDTAQTGITITATTTGLTNNSSISSSFNISDVASGTYRTTADGTWPSGTATWERFNGSAWVVATPAANTTDLLKIRHNITSNGAFAASGGVGTKMQIETNGIFNAGHNCTFQTMQINSGGTLVITDPAVDILATTGTVTVESGGKVTLNSATLNNADGFWEGTENFKSGSTLEILDWDWESNPGENCLVDTENSISPNTEGYYFGNIIFNAAPDDNDPFFFNGITGTQKLCANDLTITNTTSTENVILTEVNADVEVGGSIIVNQNVFAFADTGSSDLTHTVKGSIIGNGGTINLNTNSSGSASTTVNLEGNLQTVSGATLRSTDAGCKIVFNGNGTTQTIDLAGTLGANADFEVANNAVAQIINQDVDLANASNDFDVLTGGTLEFNYFDIIGSGRFEQFSAGVLKITSADGVNASGATGNVQNTGTRTFSQTGHYHYVGNVTPQTTGTAMTSSSTAKRILINKDNATDIVNVTQSTGTTNELNIIKGVLIETEAANISGSGDLTMETEGTYQTAVTSATVPQLSGTYTLNGASTIELNAAGDQTLRGGKGYRNLTFSVSSTKTITSATANIVGEVYIIDDAIVDVENKTFGGANTDFLMDANSVYRTAGTGTKPDAQGSYILDGNSKIVFTNTAATLQSIRLTPDYMNIDIEGVNVGTNTLATPIEMQLGSTFTVKDGATFKHSNTAGFNGGNATAIDNTNNPTITLETNSTIDYAGADQTITLFSPYYANLAISGTGVKTLGDATGIVVNEDLYVNASKLLIQEAEGITIQDAIQNEGEIEVLDTGSIVQVNEVDNNDNTGGKAGNYIIHRTTRPYMEYDYTYWSSPVEDESFTDTFDNNSSVVVPGGEPSNGNGNSVMSRIFWFDTADYEDTNDDGFDDDPNDNGCWRSVAPTDLMEKGKGYIAMGAGSDWPFNSDVSEMASGLVQSVFFDGNKIHNGSFTYPLVGDANAGDPSNNENLVGNPYPSAIDLVELRDHAQNNPGSNPVMGSTVHFWSHDTQITYDPNHLWAYNFTNADYATYNIASQEGTAAHTGSPIPTQYWASCQSIIIEAENPGDLHFKNSMRVVAQNTNFFKSQETDKDVLWLELTAENGLYRQIAVVFLEGADDTVNDFDSKRNLYPDEPDLYSLAPDDDTHLVIQGLSTFEVSKIVDLGIRMMGPGDYTFSIPQIKGIFETDQHIYLKDYKTGVLHDLSKQVYEFSIDDSELGEINDRFELRFIDETTVGTEDMALSSLSVYPNPSNDIFYFTWTGSSELDVKVFDLNARLVYVDTLQSGKGVDLQALESGIYFAKLHDGKQEITKKLVLK